MVWLGWLAIETADATEPVDGTRSSWYSPPPELEARSRAPPELEARSRAPSSRGSAVALAPAAGPALAW